MNEATKMVKREGEPTEIDRRVERAVDARRELGFQVRELPPLPRQVVMTEADASAMLSNDALDCARVAARSPGGGSRSK